METKILFRQSQVQDDFQGWVFGVSTRLRRGSQFDKIWRLLVTAGSKRRQHKLLWPQRTHGITKRIVVLYGTIYKVIEVHMECDSTN